MNEKIKKLRKKKLRIKGLYLRQKALNDYIFTITLYVFYNEIH